MISHELSEIYDCKIPLVITMDSDVLYRALLTKSSSVNKWISADVNLLRNEFERGNLNTLVLIPGQINLADPGTKPHSPLTEAMQLAMLREKLCMDFPTTEQIVYARSLS